VRFVADVTLNNEIRGRREGCSAFKHKTRERERERERVQCRENGSTLE